MVGCVGWLGGPGTVLWLVLALVLYLFWHCSRPAPALSWPVRALRICTRPHRASARTLGHPCHPATPGTPPCTPRTRTRTAPSSACSGSRGRCRGAQSGLHPGTDWPGSSPGLLHWPVLPADRHPLFTTSCHPGTALTGLNSQ